jgi:hypothetical protein
LFHVMQAGLLPNAVPAEPADVDDDGAVVLPDLLPADHEYQSTLTDPGFMRHVTPKLRGWAKRCAFAPGSPRLRWLTSGHQVPAAGRAGRAGDRRDKGV